MNELLPLHLFQGYGIELEYMIVDSNHLSVLPVTDKVLHAVAGEYLSEIEQGVLSWSNELVLHVIELKTNGPAGSLAGLAEVFDAHVSRIVGLLEPMGGRLMPTAMHPLMDPLRETALWPHEYNPIYESFDRIFGCKGHGWSNLQCAHINLPFADDEEFGKLHAAIRILLPIMPALSASSPIVEGRLTGFLDNRLHVYRNNAVKIPSVTGRVIPEAVFSKAEYEEKILHRMYSDISPHDPHGILQHEWLNARGAIVRFDRNTIEIRVIDIQECPLADIAITAAVSRVLEALISERWANCDHQKLQDVESLNAILESTTINAEAAVIEDREYLELFGYSSTRCTAGELWVHLIDALMPDTDPSVSEWLRPLRTIMEEGTLARRIVRALGSDVTVERIKEVYLELCECLDDGRMFSGSH